MTIVATGNSIRLEDVAGAAVLVTGASSGIGAALAIELCRRGARVGIVGRRVDKLAEVAERCGTEGAPGSMCRVWTVDLADPDRAGALAVEVWDELGGVDVLVNNAAIPKRRRLLAVTASELDEVMRTNFVSPVRMATELIPLMLERGSGIVVNVASLGGRLGIGNESAYCASKFALSGWSESAALDLWDTPVRIVLIQPGPIATDIWDRPDNDRAAFEGPFEPPETVAVGIIDALATDRFEHYLPDLSGVVAYKTGAIDAFLEGAATMARPRD